MSGDPRALAHAAGEARLEARELARTWIGSDTPLKAYLQPLQDIAHALTCAAGAAHRLADLAQAGISDPEAGSAAGRSLKKAGRLTDDAGGECGQAFDEASGALRLVPRLGAPGCYRRYKTTADALARLSAEAEKALKADLPLRYLEAPAEHFYTTLYRLGHAAARLGVSLDNAWARHLGDGGRAKPDRGDGRLAHASETLIRASGCAARAAGIISDALPQAQRRAAK